MPKDVWFGIHVSPEGYDFKTMKRICVEAETCGLDFVTIADHFIESGMGGTGRGAPLECWTTLAGLAAVTNHIKLGSLVTCYGYRPPPVLAKMATTVDVISGGRLIFGIGAGWHEEEFKSFMGRFPPFEERLKGLEEAVEICKRMFTKERTTYHGRLYHVENVLNSPQPLQKAVPILIGGGGKRTLEIAAKHADISHFLPYWDLKVIEGKLSALKMHCTAIGRDYEEIRTGIGFVLSLGRTEAEVQSKIKQTAENRGQTPEALLSMERYKAGTPENVAKNLKKYLDLGFGFVSFTLLPYDTREDIQLLVEEVISQLS